MSAAMDQCRGMGAMVESEMSPSPRDVTVIGAGVVGICAALYLQRRGHRVRVLDDNPPGSGASAGNSGIFSTAAVVPLATPGVIRAVPRMLTDPRSALKIRWRHLPWLAPWLMRFVASSRPSRVEAA